jgi:NAD(P)-dependent dehydrogenase (short-subunit alcohol dehydrogenase family)
MSPPSAPGAGETRQLAGKVIVVTGAGRGLGAAFAVACASAGARVAVAELREDWGLRTVAALLGAGAEAAYVPLDLADPRSVTAMAGEVMTRFGRIDGLVNNGALATGLGGKTHAEIDIETWDRVMAVNVRGTWLAVRACAPHMRAVGGGAIVNIGSDTAEWGAPRLLHYVASKGAIAAMSRSLARELGPDGISVNTVAPGLTMVEATMNVTPERQELYVRGRAMTRTQQPEDIVGLVVFLLSPSARFVTGQLILANGGFVLR